MNKYVHYRNFSESGLPHPMAFIHPLPAFVLNILFLLPTKYNCILAQNPIHEYSSQYHVSSLPKMSSCEYCGVYVGTKMGQQMNVTTLYIHEYPVNVALGLCTAAAPDPARGILVVGGQHAELQLTQPS